MTPRWPAALRLMHWLTALILAVSIPAVLAAQALAEINTPLAERLAETHIAAGVAILALALARLSARLVLPAPVAPRRPFWLRLAVKAGTVGLYGLMIVMPATGLLKLTLSGFDVTAFGVTIMVADAPAPALARALSRMHQWLGWLFVAAAAIHVAATLAHRRLFGEAVLQRML